MRIGIEYTAAVAEPAGIGRFTRELVTATLAQDTEHEYLLVAPLRALPPPWLGSRPHARWVPLPVSARLATVLWHRLRLPAPVEWLTGPLDLFHASDYLLPPLRRAKGLVTIHDLSFLRLPQLAEPRLVRFLAGGVPRAIARAALVLADSQHTRHDILTYFEVPPEKVVVVYGGVSDAFQPVEQGEALSDLKTHYGLPDQYLLTVSRLEPRKNLIGLLQAYRLLLDRHRTAPPLVIAGDKGWLYQPIFQAVTELHLTDCVRFLGHVPDAHLPALLSGASVFVYPSFYEGFGLPPLEALACGTPVVASSSSSLPEVLGDAAVLVPPTDAEALAEAIDRVLADEGLQRDLRQRGLAQARRFTWDAAARQLLAAYNLALGATTALPGVTQA